MATLANTAQQHNTFTVLAATNDFKWCYCIMLSTVYIFSPVLFDFADHNLCSMLSQPLYVLTIHHTLLFFHVYFLLVLAAYITRGQVNTN